MMVFSIITLIRILDYHFTHLLTPCISHPICISWQSEANNWDLDVRSWEDWNSSWSRVLLCFRDSNLFIFSLYLLGTDSATCSAHLYLWVQLDSLHLDLSPLHVWCTSLTGVGDMVTNSSSWNDKVGWDIVRAWEGEGMATVLAMVTLLYHGAWFH